MYETIKDKLENFPKFRERRFRAKYLVILALRATGLEDRIKESLPIDLDELSDFAISYDSYRRIWGMVMTDHPELRGSDYSPDKDILEQKKMIELGYSVGHTKDLKKYDELLAREKTRSRD